MPVPPIPATFPARLKKLREPHFLRGLTVTWRMTLRPTAYGFIIVSLCTAGMIMRAINVKRLGVAAMLFLFAASAQADVVTDWNQRASEITVAHQAGPWGQAPMVLIQAAVFDSVNAVTRRYPQAGYLKLDAPAGASIDAAVAAVNRAVLIRMATTQGAASRRRTRPRLSQCPKALRKPTV